MTTPRILVCGNRDWTCRRTIAHWLREAQRFAGNHTRNILFHGAAPGADSIAADIARNAFGFAGLWEIESYPANWDKYGTSAGPIRNREMADARPDIGLAFGKLYRGSKLTGTGDMVSVLNAREIPVIVIGEPLK